MSTKYQLQFRNVATGETLTLPAQSVAGSEIEYARMRAHAAAHRGDGSTSVRVVGDDREYVRTQEGRTRVTRDSGETWVF